MTINCYNTNNTENPSTHKRRHYDHTHDTCSSVCNRINMVSEYWQQNLIQYKERNTNNRVPFVITYHPALSNLFNIVREKWTTIQKHPELCKIFKEPLVLAFRKSKSLKDLLVRASISPRSADNSQCQKCNSRRCMTRKKNIQMHTEIQEHTYRRRIHLPPGMCHLCPSIHRRN